MDPVARAGKEQERVLRARERLRFRVFSAVRDAALGTRLFRTHFELHEPEIVVNVYPQHVDVLVWLNEGQLRLLPARSRAEELGKFVEELRGSYERIAPALELTFTADPARFGGSQAVLLVDVPSSYRAVLLRHPGE